MEKYQLPEFESLEDIAEFWDTHSTADYDDLTQDVTFEVDVTRQAGFKTVSLLPELNDTLETLAKNRGISVETLVNVWLTEKVKELT